MERTKNARILYERFKERSFSPSDSLKRDTHKKEKKSSGVKMHFLSRVLGVWVQIKKCVLLRMLLWLLSVLL